IALQSGHAVGIQRFAVPLQVAGEHIAIGGARSAWAVCGSRSIRSAPPRRAPPIAMCSPATWSGTAKRWMPTA
ncbi:MAG: hypothetical protein RLW42_16230, partial [Gammaproteobacteria bacterium]